MSRLGNLRTTEDHLDAVGRAVIQQRYAGFASGQQSAIERGVSRAAIDTAGIHDGDFVA